MSSLCDPCVSTAVPQASASSSCTRHMSKKLSSSLFQRRRTLFKLAARKVKLAKQSARMRLWKTEVDQEYDKVLTERREEARRLRIENEQMRASSIQEFVDKCTALTSTARDLRVKLEQRQNAAERTVPDFDEFSSDLMD